MKSTLPLQNGLSERKKKKSTLPIQNETKHTLIHIVLCCYF